MIYLPAILMAIILNILNFLSAHLLYLFLFLYTTLLNVIIIGGDGEKSPPVCLTQQLLIGCSQLVLSFSLFSTRLEYGVE